MDKLEKKTKRQEKKLLNKEKNYELNEPPHRTVLEEVGNAVSHGVGALLAIYLFILLLLKSDTNLKLIATFFYGISLFLEMIMSCLYHAFKKNSKVKRIWRRFDYSSIYLLIGGTFAPLFLVDWGGTVGIVLFCIQWGLIIAGITFLGIFGPGRIRFIHLILYFVLGWSGIMFIPGWIQHNIKLLLWIVGGGLIYTFGMIPFFLRDKKAAHFIWHIIVIAGAVVQWIGIYFYIY